MKQAINLMDFSMDRGALLERSDSRAVLECAKGEIGRFSLAGKPGKIAGVSWQDAKYVVLDLASFMSWSIVFMFEFWEEGNRTDEPNITVRMSTLPFVKTRLVLPMEALDSQRIFLPRTPGKLRSFVHGKKVDTAKITRFALSVREGFETQRLEITDVYLTDEEPDYPLQAVKLVDEMGQLLIHDWPGKTKDVEELNANLKEQLKSADTAAYCGDWSRYGGWKKKKLEAKGFFSLQNDGHRWWLVDPEGYVFFTSGMDCVRPGDIGPVTSIRPYFTWVPGVEGEYAQAWEPPRIWKDGMDSLQFNFAVANLIRAFGAKWKQCWTMITKANLVRWGFNTIGAFSSLEFVKDSGLPYLLPLMNFPTTQMKVFRDFPDVFSEEYRSNADIYAQQMLKYKDDRNIIGYFLRNEPEWAFTAELEIAEELLDTDTDLVSKDVFIRFVSEKYNGSIEELNRAWNLKLPGFEALKARIPKAAALSQAASADLNAFSKLMIEEYVKVPSLAVRKVDPVHLNMGMRYAFILYENQLAGKEYFDVFSINCYKIDPTDVLKKTVAMAKMPVIIGEYHFGALDRGIQATGIIGVASQKDRGLAYQCYLEHAAAIPECVGVQYFQYNDQATLGRPDGENYQIGIVDVCNRPLEEFVEGVVLTHERMYDVANGSAEVADARPQKIISNIAS